MPKGFLLVLMQPPPAFEEEFNAWYEAEHIPERVAVPGFETGLRFICTDGHPRYLAMYDLANHDVLKSPDYLKVAFDQSSPWTKRVTSRVRVWRSSGDQIHPGSKITGKASRITLLRFAGLKAGDAADLTTSVRRAFEERAETSQIRVLAYDNGLIGFIEARAPFAQPIDVRALGTHASALDLVNTYAPYQ